MLNRLQAISYETSTADTTYTINSAPTQTFEYLTTGDKTRLKKVYDSVVSEENSYDTQSRISQYKMEFAKPDWGQACVIRVLPGDAL